MHQSDITSSVNNLLQNRVHHGVTEDTEDGFLMIQSQEDDWIINSASWGTDNEVSRTSSKG